MVGEGGAPQAGAQCPAQSWEGKSRLGWGLDEPEISVQGHSVNSA